MINFGTSIMQDFALGDSFVERIDLGDTTIFDPYTTVTGSLPLMFNGRAEWPLKNYSVYGTASGSGVETENLFDEQWISGVWSTADGSYVPNDNRICSKNPTYVDANTSYVIKSFPKSVWVRVLFYDALGNYLGSQNNNSNFTTPNDCAYVNFYYAIDLTLSDDFKVVIVPGSTSPTTYIPFGYKIPISISDGTNTSNYDLFIGYSKLGENEHLDFLEQKIYKDVSGTLTPTDPPVPLPAINAYQGENTLSSTETVGTVTVKGRISEVTPTT